MNQPDYPFDYVFETSNKEQTDKALARIAKNKPILAKKTKGNKHYKVGRALEYAVKKTLEQDGYTVFRSAGSHSQADLIAIESQDVDGFIVPCVKLIQCKRHRNLMTNKELKDFYDFCDGLGCTAIIAWRDKGIHIQDIVIK